MGAAERPRLTSFPWQFAAALALAFAASRAVGVLGPANLRWLLPLGFTLMALTPFVLLDAPGRRRIGLTVPAGVRFLGFAVVLGGAAAFACFLLGRVAFGAGPDNWFVTIANNYRQIADTTGWPPGRLHLVFTLPALIFSPIGEEIFFRGYLQEALERRFSVRASTLAECGAFGVVHVCHHGLVFAAAGLTFRPLSGLIWIFLMFAVALLFAHLRKSSGSLWPAIGAHAGFNLVMNLTIFAFLW